MDGMDRWVGGCWAPGGMVIHRWFHREATQMGTKKKRQGKRGKEEASGRLVWAWNWQKSEPPHVGCYGAGSTARRG